MHLAYLCSVNIQYELPEQFGINMRQTYCSRRPSARCSGRNCAAWYGNATDLATLCGLKALAASMKT